MAKRKIPSKDMVVSIMKEVLKRRKVITTLNELWMLVLTNLKKINRNFALSRNRIKKLIVQVQGIEIKVKTRKGNRKMVSCPVCNSQLSETYGKNLFGKRILIGYKCRKCSYKSGLKTSMPMKYIFVKKPH